MYGCPINTNVVKQIDPKYQAGLMVWADNKRGVDADGKVSCWGPNISDVHIGRKDRKPVPLVGSAQPDELIGVKATDKVHLCGRDGELTTLKDVLADLPNVVAYRGMTCEAQDDARVAYRVEEAWLELEGAETCEMAVVNYSYQTLRADDPANLILLSSPQGLSVHTSDVGQQPLLAHKVLEDGTVSEHWFEAERMEGTRVGAAQCDDAAPEGKAKAKALGIEGMGPHANAFVIVSIPLKQQPVVPSRGAFGDGYGGYGGPLSGSLSGAAYPVYRSLGATDVGADDDGPSPEVYRSLGGADSVAARVSVGARKGTAASHGGRTYERDPAQRIVVTIIRYNAIKSVRDVKPSDVKLAVNGMERVYDLGDARGTLSQLKGMLTRLEPSHMDVIHKKLRTDPPAPMPADDGLTPCANALAAFA